MSTLLILLQNTILPLLISVHTILPQYNYPSSLLNILNAENLNIISLDEKQEIVEVTEKEVDIPMQLKLNIVPNLEIHNTSFNFDAQKLVNYKNKLEEDKRIAEQKRLEEEERQRILAEQKAAEEARQSILGVTSGFNGDVVTAIKNVFGANWYPAYLIAMCESSLNPNAIGDQHLMYGNGFGASYGLFQIRYLEGRPIPSWLINVDNNIQFAYNLSNGGTNWSQWSCAKKVLGY